MNSAFASDADLDRAEDDPSAFDDADAIDGLEELDELDGLDSEGYDAAGESEDIGDDLDGYDTFAQADDLDAYGDTDTGDDLDLADEDHAAEAAWSAFEDDIADALDVDGTDEFLSRVLGGLSRAAGAIARHSAPAARIARHAQGAARGVAQVAGGTGQLANAAALAARWLGAPNAAAGLQRVARGAGQVGAVAQRAQRTLGAVPTVRRAARRVATGAGTAAAASNPMAALIAQLGQLIGNQADDFEAFDAMADLYIEDGVDEALPAAVGLAARAAARGLGWRNVGELSQAARRALVRGIATATRSLVNTRGPQAVRAVPRIARAVSQRTRQRRLPPAQAARQVARTVPRTARQVASRPNVVRRLARPTAAPASSASAGRPRGVGFGVPAMSRGSTRRYQFPGPVELTIRAL